MPVTITLHDSVARRLEKQANQHNVSLEQWAVEVLLRQSETVMPASRPESGTWTDELNARRCDLIDRHIEGTITSIELQELNGLQAQLRHHLDQNAPFDLAGAQRIHQKLVEKKRHAESQSEASDDPL